MDFAKIKKEVLDVYLKCNIKAFPIDCLSVLDSLGIKHIPYSSLSERKRSHLVAASNDSYRMQNTIYYNDDTTKIIPERIKFNLMHELGHIRLDHKEISKSNEDEADEFAGWMLAPLPLIFFFDASRKEDLIRIFAVSNECADVTLSRYEAWHAPRFCFDPNDGQEYIWQDETEKKISGIFYSSDLRKHVFRTNKCEAHNHILYNDEKCPYCIADKSKVQFINFGTDKSLCGLESRWLYGEN